MFNLSNLFKKVFHSKEAVVDTRDEEIAQLKEANERLQREAQQKESLDKEETERKAKERRAATIKAATLKVEEERIAQLKQVQDEEAQRIKDSELAKEAIKIATKEAEALRVFDPVKFDSWSNNHRHHQREALAAIVEHDIGQINMPTGTGKTRVQTHIHVEDMINSTEPGVYVISSHRLLLNRNLIMEIIKVANKVGLSFDVLFIGSKKEDDADIINLSSTLNAATIKVESTTSQDKVSLAWENAKSKGRHLLCVSTYHSIQRLLGFNLPENGIRVITYDESHTTVNREFRDNIQTIKHLPKREFFFTATRRVGEGSDLGQDDFEFYGKPLYEFSPREAIELGEIVPPRLHLVKNLAGVEYSGPVAVTMEAFEEHQKLVGNNLAAKMLVSCSSTDDMEILLRSEALQSWSKKNNISVISFSSVIPYTVGFENVDRQRAFNAMMSLVDSDKAILLHLDILAEGIDLPGITGVFPMRGLGDAKLLQTIGRAARLYHQDRSKVYAKTLEPLDHDNWIKPYAWVILPNNYEGLDTDKTKEYIKKILREYKMPIEAFVPEEYFLTMTTSIPDGITEKDVASADRSQVNLEHLIEDLYIEELSNLESDDLIRTKSIPERIHNAT